MFKSRISVNVSVPPDFHKYTAEEEHQFWKEVWEAQKQAEKAYLDSLSKTKLNYKWEGESK